MRYSRKKKLGKPKAIIYTRVSTEEQGHGFSPRAQEEKLRTYCRDNDIEIVAHFDDQYSGKTFDRPEFNKLMKFIETRRGEVDFLIVVRFDRFGRNFEESILVAARLKKLGVEVKALDQPIESSVPETLVLKAIYMAIPEVENSRRARSTIAGMRRSMKDGNFLHHAPKGYSRVRVGEKTMLSPNHDAPFVRESFEIAARTNAASETIRREMWAKGFRLSKNQFVQMLRNPIYAGLIFIREYDGEPECFVKGKHEAIVSEELFAKVQERMRRLSRDGEKKSFGHHPVYYLKGFLKCKRCGNKLTASASRGNGGAYGYYHCQHGCPERFAVQRAHTDFTKKLESFKLQPEIGDLYLALIEDVFKSQEADKTREVKLLNKELSEIENEIEQYTKAYFITKEMDSELYHKLMAKKNERKAELKLKIESIEEVGSEFLKFQRFGVNLLTHLDEIFAKASASQKAEILGSIFTENLVYENGRYRTTKINEVVEYIWRFQKEIEENKTGQGSSIDHLPCMAPRVGLEPTTP